MSKGDSPRPKSVPPETYAERWARTFCPPLREPVMDPREAMRQRHLAEAKAVIDSAPPPKEPKCAGP